MQNAKYRMQNANANEMQRVCLTKAILHIKKLSFRASAHTGVGISWIIREFLVYPGDCHTSDVGHWFAMTAFILHFDIRECFVDVAFVRAGLLVNCQRYRTGRYPGGVGSPLHRSHAIARRGFPANRAYRHSGPHCPGCRGPCLCRCTATFLSSRDRSFGPGTGPARRDIPPVRLSSRAFRSDAS